MNKAFWEVKRETSKYNKYMKWRAIFYYENKEVLASQWFKTEKEARECVALAVWQGKRGLHIGDKVSYTDYEPV